MNSAKKRKGKERNVLRKTKSNALEICNKHELLKINLSISFWERTGVGGDNKNVEFQIQIASQVSLCSV